MEYQNIINLFYNALNQPSKFRTKNWVQIKGVSLVDYNINSQIKFKATILKSSLFDFCDAYILVKGTTTITGHVGPPAGRAAVQIKTSIENDKRNKGVIFKNCVPSTDCIREINIIEIDNAEDIDVVIPIYNLIEYKDNY